MVISQPEQRARRRMTEAEKIEFRKRRIVKPCDECARRKRKCHHKQAQMEVVQTSTPTRSWRDKIADFFDEFR